MRYWDGDLTALQPYVDENIFTYPQAEIHFAERYSGDLDKVIDDFSVETSYKLEQIWETHCINLDHQLLGYPTLQQPWYGERDVDELVLLLQLDIDSEVEMKWGDCGTIYFFYYIREFRRTGLY